MRRGPCGAGKALVAPNRIGNDQKPQIAKENGVFQSRQRKVKGISREFCKWVSPQVPVCNPVEILYDSAHRKVPIKGQSRSSASICCT